MSERLSIVVNDPPTVGLTTEWIIEQLQHAIMRRDDNNELRIAHLSSGDRNEAWPYHREWVRWSEIVENWEVELFRREHHKNQSETVEQLQADSMDRESFWLRQKKLWKKLPIAIEKRKRQDYINMTTWRDV